MTRAYYTFTIKISGYGSTEEEAWRNAKMHFGESQHSKPSNAKVKIEKDEDDDGD